jgi:hypothetical protein
MKTSETYSITISVPRDVQKALYSEQARQGINGEKKKPLARIASEWLMAKAAEKAMP